MWKLSWVDHWQASCTRVAAGGIWHRQAALAGAAVHDERLGSAGMVTRSYGTGLHSVAQALTVHSCRITRALRCQPRTSWMSWRERSQLCWAPRARPSSQGPTTGSLSSLRTTGLQVRSAEPLLQKVLAGLASCMLLAASGAVPPCMLLTMDILGDLGQRKDPVGLAGRPLLAAGGAALLSEC